MTKFIFVASLFLTSLATPAFCADKVAPKKVMNALTPAQREEMAATHEKMAACLRSDKSFEECHKIWMDSHEGHKGGCPMMGKGHMRGMKHGYKENDNDGPKGEDKE